MRVVEKGGVGAGGDDRRRRRPKTIISIISVVDSAAAAHAPHIARLGVIVIVVVVVVVIKMVVSFVQRRGQHMVSIRVRVSRSSVRGVSGVRVVVRCGKMIRSGVITSWHG